jgi:hypothetical protein
MADVIVPKTPKSAFNPGRTPSGLITAQVEHLEAALGMFKGAGQRRIRPRTEGEAAEYIAQLTAQLHPQPGATVVETPVPPGVTPLTRARAKSIPRQPKKRARPAAKKAKRPRRATPRARKRGALKSAKAAPRRKTTRKTMRRTRTTTRTRAAKRG